MPEGGSPIADNPTGQPPGAGQAGLVSMTNPAEDMAEASRALTDGSLAESLVVLEEEPHPVTPVVRIRPNTRAEAPPPLDDEVVEATRRGERWAWEAAYQAYAKALTGFLVLRLRDRDEVAEALSETFLRALDRASTFRGDANSFRAWLFRIARNVATDRFRVRQRLPRGDH